MESPLYRLIPPQDQLSPGKILDRFLDFVASKKLELYPAQEEAILALVDDKNVILNTPTGSGKSLVALALHFDSIARGRRSFYTCPIKALVNEKFRDLCRDFGPEQVGMITGDGSVNQNAPIICCTAEILSNLALREGSLAHVDDVVMDEFHYYSDKQRGVAWQVPLLALPQARFLLMSATLGDVDFFASELTKLNQKPSEIVRSSDRPVPLDFHYSENPLHETISDLVKNGLAPVYLVNFSQREAAEEAQNLLSVDFCSKEEKKAIGERLEGTRFQSPYGKEMQKLLRHGVGLHHAGLLPRYRILVEKLAQLGLLKVISGTDTLGVGVNVPIRTVLFTKLSKFDGEKNGLLTVRDFQQISGRAGRRGYDTRGTVVAQAPEHVIENLRQKAKEESGAKKKPGKTAPPGFVMWTRETFQKLINSQPEALVSRFQVSHAMLLNVLSRENGYQAIKKLIRASHGNSHSKKQLRKVGFELFRALHERKIVEVERIEGSASTKIFVHATLQEDFSLNQTLALYLLDTIRLLDKNSSEYALDVLTLIESILESPDLILRKQLDRLKAEKMAEMKASGVEYDQRQEELEKLEHPKPRRDFIYDTFNQFRYAHPWVGQENIRPKSIAREMYESYHSFAEYIREYDLQRAEGILLRYLSEVYKVIEQTVPDTAKNEDLRDMAIYFGQMIREVDSSLLEDWEIMRKGANSSGEVSSNEKSFTLTPISDANLKRILRNEMHRLVRALASRDLEAVREILGSPELAVVQILESQLKRYFLDHVSMRTDPQARHPKHLEIKKSGSGWEIEQVLLDPEEHNDWTLKVLGRYEAESKNLRLTFCELAPIA